MNTFVSSERFETRERDSTARMNRDGATRPPRTREWRVINLRKLRDEVEERGRQSRRMEGWALLDTQSKHFTRLPSLRCNLPFPPHKEILTFPEIRNLPEGRGLIPSTCHVPQPRRWILVKQISLVALMRIVLFFNSETVKKKKKLEKILRWYLYDLFDPCIWIEALWNIKERFFFDILDIWIYCLRCLSCFLLGWKLSILYRWNAKNSFGYILI